MSVMATTQQPFSSNTTASPTLASAYAQHVLNKSLLAQRGAKNGEFLSPKPIPHKIDPDAPTASDLNGKICIVGAGVTGLMVAMCLQAVGIYNFDILEASNRTGGRVFTHTLDKSGSPHDYYDVGAMRIPDIATMQSTINMIDNVLNIGAKKVPYGYHIFDSKTGHALEPTMYLWKVGIPPQIQYADKQFVSAIQTITSAFGTTLADWDAAFAKYIESGPPDGIDDYSTREWLKTQANSPGWIWNYAAIEAAETMETSTGLFDQAFSETIIDYCDFQATIPPKPQPAKNWYRLEGGMSGITDAMALSVAGQGTPSIRGAGVNVTLNTAVTAMTDNISAGSISVSTVNTETNTSQTTTDYVAVFNTTALPCLERMDISALNLDDDTLTGIRALSYDRATKVVIKFTNNWWYPLLGSQIGGVSSSDLPISNVVYPSWYDGPEEPAVLMISYAWAQDATRMGSLIPDYTLVPPSKTDQIVTLCLQNLAKLWASVPGAPTYGQMLDMYVTHHAWSWSHDPWTGGAFALFGPGQFKNLYPAFFQPKCEGKFNICGEATSAHHAWISGALDSAYTTVMTWLSYNNMQKEMNLLKASPLGVGVDAHPAEVNETLLQWAAHLSPGYTPLKKA